MLISFAQQHICATVVQVQRLAVCSLWTQQSVIYGCLLFQSGQHYKAARAREREREATKSGQISKADNQTQLNAAAFYLLQLTAANQSPWRRERNNQGR